MAKSPVKPAANSTSTVIELLNERLADAIDLALLTKQAHWNLRGLQFIAIHEMLDMFRKDLDEHVDTIAERVAQLGGISFGTTQAVAARTKLKPYPTEITRIADHLRELTSRYDAAAKRARDGIDEADDADDPDSADILTAYSRSLDKWLWFLRSHQE
jgi:starvation-inducible DNA-binding protein